MYHAFRVVGLIGAFVLVAVIMHPDRHLATAQTDDETPADIDLVAQEVAELSTRIESVQQELAQMNTKTDQMVQELTSVAQQVERIATQLEQRTLTTIGYVEIVGVPDIATAQIDIKTQGDTLSVAVTQNQQSVTDMQARIVSLGIGDDLIRVADPQIAPVLGDERIIEGYRVLTPILVDIRNPNTDGAGVLEQVISLGGSSFKDITFDVEDPEQYRQQAREQALAQARTHAESYATLVDGQLGSIVSITEDLNIRTFQQEPLPGEPTEQIFSSEIAVEFEIQLAP